MFWSLICAAVNVPTMNKIMKTSLQEVIKESPSSGVKQWVLTCTPSCRRPPGPRCCGWRRPGGGPAAGSAAARTRPGWTWPTAGRWPCWRGSPGSPPPPRTPGQHRSNMNKGSKCGSFLPDFTVNSLEQHLARKKSCWLAFEGNLHVLPARWQCYIAVYIAVYINITFTFVIFRAIHVWNKSLGRKYIQQCCPGGFCHTNKNPRERNLLVKPEKFRMI